MANLSIAKIDISSYRARQRIQVKAAISIAIVPSFHDCRKRAFIASRHAACLLATTASRLVVQLLPLSICFLRVVVINESHLCHTRRRCLRDFPRGSAPKCADFGLRPVRPHAEIPAEVCSHGSCKEGFRLGLIPCFIFEIRFTALTGHELARKALLSRCPKHPTNRSGITRRRSTQVC